MEYYSQHKQDEYLNKNVFKEKTNGIFIDIGAHDGISLSNTYFFEKYKNWTGICIEPMPDTFQKLLENRTCICVNGCISNNNEKAKFLLVKGGGHQMLSGLSEKYDKRHLNRIDAEIKIYGGSKEEIEVNCYLLSDLTNQNNILKVDYCSIDVEGAEYDILTSIDFNKVDIDVFTIENNYHDKKIKKLLESKNYKLIEVLDCDEVYKKQQ